MPPAATSSGQALSQLQAFAKGAQTPDQLLNTAQGKYGVPAAQQQVTGLQGAIQNTTNLLNKVAPSVMGRTQNSLVTDAQANRLIGNEQAPIQSNLQTDTQGLSTAEQGLSQAESQANTEANLGYQGQQGQLSYLQNVYNTLSAQEQAQRDEAYRQQVFQEQQRQFNDQQALARRAAAGTGGPSFGSLGGGGSTPAAPAKATGSPTATDPRTYLGLIQALRQQQGGATKWGWGALANEFKNRGIDVAHGSPADQALNAYFRNAGGGPISSGGALDLGGASGPFGLQNILSSLGLAGAKIGGLFH